MNKKYLLGVKFKNDPKVVLYKTDENIEVGQLVSVETQLGCFAGKIVSVEESTEKKTKEIPAIKNKLSSEDVKELELDNTEKEKLLRTFKDLIKKHSLPIKPLDIEKCIDGGLLFLFSSENRVDFREMVKELSHKISSQVILKQVGARDCARMLDGCGPCGKRVCCRQFLGVQEGITMDMARIQGMGGKGTGKISGCCGKLMCCLRFENDFYKEALGKMPKIGEEIKTEKGKGKIISVDVIQNKLDVILEDKTRFEVKL
ncbi:hypothetical protein HGB13_04115 [bacterium]|nr:hypothetical protein [bacterium]